jgi:hypothetical protein
MRRTSIRSATIAAGVGLAAAVAPALAAAQVTEVPCRGNEAICTANVSLKGGASNKPVMLMLPGTDLKIRAVNGVPSSLQGAFLRSKGTYSLGGSAYSFTFSAVGSIDSGYMSMTFTNPQRPQGRVPRAVTCLGGERVCTAHISLRGGADDKRIQVKLPGTNLKLAARVPTPPATRKLFSVSGGDYSLGGSVYTFTLDTDRSFGKGAWLALTFRDPAR